ncbi:MAG: ribosome biogenesis GTPase Der [Chlamydiae bacterium CG10_big_fil_rev_8_21_14_0_10_35_9]|nr:MAG: ribosome biogenesis GTPase Der [Chlamydiae bacterium CG10_big_fil_rev_8_21_14_0_10_35_9]
MKLALVGRPNVGKSALFNRICKKRIAIVDDMEGVTRDRIYGEAEFAGQTFEVIDTGGIHFGKNIPFTEEVRRQSQLAIEEADGIILVVDGKAGVQSLDADISKILLKTHKPVVLAVNKIDDLSLSDLVFNFFELGIEKMVPVSALHGLHVAELLENIFEKVPQAHLADEVDAICKVAIVGRANVGKSTLINALLNEERTIVSPIAGTTRDAIDIPLDYNESSYLMIDTAGIRRKNKEKEVVEKFAAMRTENAITRADVCVLVIDANEGLTSQEKRIINQIESEGKGLVIFLNKWDLVKGFRMEHSIQAIYEESPFIKHCPIIVGSAKEKRNITDIFEKVNEVQENLAKKLSTSELNQFIEKCFQKVHPPMILGKRLRVYYMTQKTTNPPRFILFINYPNLMTKAYKNYLINSFRQEYAFTGCPIEFILRGKKKS